MNDYKNYEDYKDENKKKENSLNFIHAVDAAEKSAASSVKAAAKKFTIGEYERSRFEDNTALESVRQDIFNNGSVKDYMSGKKLVKNQAEAKSIYADQWAEHAAEMDHTDPLKNIHDRHRNDAWNTEADIKEVGNRRDNIEALSKHNNAAKGAKSNQEFAENNKKLGAKGRSAAIERGKAAQAESDKLLLDRKIKNIVSTGHQAGLAGAKAAGLAGLGVSGIRNITAYFNGDKDAIDAVLDTGKDAVLSAGGGYVVSGGMTVLQHTFSKSSNQLIQSLTKSNIVGSTIAAVMTLGSTVSSFAAGEISTEDFILELGDKGASFLSGSAGAAIGQMAIPIPVVGAAIGSLIGYALSSEYYSQLVNAIKASQFAHERRIRIERECEEAIKAMQEYRAEFEKFAARWFADYAKSFKSAFDEMDRALFADDINGFIAGANSITLKLGGKPAFKNMNEFESIMLSDEVFVI